MAKCPVCHTENDDVTISSRDYGNEKFIVCPRCGKFKIYGNEFQSLLDDTASYDIYYRSKISHWIRKNPSENNELILTKEIIKNLENTELPKAKEQSDNLIIWLGDLCKSPEEAQNIKAEYLAAIIGAKDNDGVEYILKHLKEEDLITYSGVGISPTLGLTFHGWDCYDELKRVGIVTRRVFMAMKYGDPTLNRIFENHFKKAVDKTGFDLFILKDHPKAGVIDDHIRVEIRNSRFLVADLTHHNNGAYWEAGFAEGLGKPVIYLCEKNVFEKESTHFDTHHCTTVLWSEENIANAEKELKDIIRNTLPLEAKMTDEEEPTE